VRGFNLNLVAPFCSHVAESLFGILQHLGIINLTKAHRDTGRIKDGVCSYADEIGGVGSGSRSENQLEAILCVDFETG